MSCVVVTGEKGAVEGRLLRIDSRSLVKQRGLVEFRSHGVLARSPKSSVVSPGWADTGLLDPNSPLTPAMLNGCLSL